MQMTQIYVAAKTAAYKLATSDMLKHHCHIYPMKSFCYNTDGL